MRFRWCISPTLPLLSEQLARELKLPALIIQCLVNRGLSDTDGINNFLEPRLKALADPFLLPGMELAVGRLIEARERGEALAIFGDYDVDGVTATALLYETLTRLGWRVECYLPSRMEEGYGLSREGVENCLKKFPVKLVLAVDCGSSSRDQIAEMKRRGIDVIVVDHHQVSSPAPEPVALVNPRAASRTPEAGASSACASAQPIPFAELCSAGLGFKLAHALVKRGREKGITEATDFDLRPLLDLVALGTIADLVPLTGENRILVSAGLDRLNRTQRPGLVALKQVAKTASPLGVFETGFQLAPRLNAAGRLETASAALDLLNAGTLDEALPLARKLDACNQERRHIERQTLEEASAAIQASFDPANHFVIVQGRDPWHVGVVGIVASRLLHQYYRPTIILGGEGGEWRGSGRSVAGFDLAAALRECGDLLVRYGGHAMAAGLTIEPAKVEPFRQRFNEVAKSRLKTEDLQPALRLDSEVKLADMDFGAVRQLERLGPVGQGNAPAQFVARKLTHQRPLQRIGPNKQHVKMWVTDGVNNHESVWWGAGNESLPVGQFDLAFVPRIDTYNGRAAVQLKVLDWRTSE